MTTSMCPLPICRPVRVLTLTVVVLSDGIDFDSKFTYDFVVCMMYTHAHMHGYIRVCKHIHTYMHGAQQYIYNCSAWDLAQ